MNAVEYAIELKKKTVEYYKKAALSCDHRGGKKIFELLLMDEQHHLEVLNDILRDSKLDFVKLRPIETIKNELDILKDELREKTACSVDDIEALRIALELEIECINYFKQQVIESDNEFEKKLFQKFIHEEEEHYKVLSNTYEFLDDTGNWFMWEDHSILEG